MELKDYYQILGIGMNAAPEEIKKAFKKRAFETHPDMNPGKNEEFLLVSEAYQVLSSPLDRRSYDARLKNPMEEDLMSVIFSTVRRHDGNASSEDIARDLYDAAKNNGDFMRGTHEMNERFSEAFRDIFGGEQERRYLRMKVIKLSQQSGDITMEQSDSNDLVTVYGGCRVAPIGDSLYIENPEGRVILSRSCLLDVMGVDSSVFGSVGVPGSIKVAKGLVNLEICSPMKVGVTTDGKHRVYGPGFEQRGIFFVPRGHNPRECLEIITMRGDVHIKYTGAE